MTAHRAVFADDSVAGQIILVPRGAGRVGHYAIQWASQAAARVIATASNEDDGADCLQAGAAVVVNHRAEYFSDAVLDAADGKLVDRIVEVEYGANLAKAVEVLQTGGTIATYSSSVDSEPKLPFFKLMYKDITTRFVIIYAMTRDSLSRGARWVNALFDQVTVCIDQHRRRGDPVF
jgi:NADPH2:quinone reductase